MSKSGEDGEAKVHFYKSPHEKHLLGTFTKTRFCFTCLTRCKISDSYCDANLVIDCMT